MSQALRMLDEDEGPKKDAPWYQNGLNFKCTGCGKCCSGGPGYIWLTEKEIAAISAYLQMSVDTFSKHYLRKIGRRYSLRELPAKADEQFDCIFLKDRACSIYPVRPTQCQTYPYWPHIMTSEFAWSREAANCEGINSDAPTVALAHIEKQLEIHKTHSPMQ